MTHARAAVAQRISELDQLVEARWPPEVFRRFQCVWLTHVLDLSAQEIAAALDLNVATVRRIRAEFARDGVCAIDGKGNRGGRRNQCMSLEEERAFLKSHTDLLERPGIGEHPCPQAGLRVPRGQDHPQDHDLSPPGAARAQGRGRRRGREAARAPQAACGEPGPEGRGAMIPASRERARMRVCYDLDAFFECNQCDVSD